MLFIQTFKTHPEFLLSFTSSLSSSSMAANSSWASRSLSPILPERDKLGDSLFKRKRKTISLRRNVLYQTCCFCCCCVQYCCVVERVLLTNK